MWQRMNLGGKLITILVAILLAAFLVGALVLNRTASRLVHETAIMSAETANATIVDMVEVFADQVERSADRLMGALQLSIRDPFHLDAGAKLKVGEQLTPVLRLGGKPVNLDEALVDQFTRATGGVATLFVRDGDDFVRISTSLKKPDGERALGTLLGAAHPAYRALMAKESYRGATQLFGREYYTKYQPILEDGVVIGALFIGVDYTDELQVLRRRIKATRVGETGYVYVMDSRPGNTLGRLIIHPAKEGESLLEIKDAGGRLFVKEMMEKHQGVIFYPWQNPGEQLAREKVVAYGHVAKFGWLIASGAYEDDLGRNITAVMYQVAGLGLVLAVGLTLFIMVAVRRMVSRPLGTLQQFCQEVQQTQDFTLAVPYAGSDEVGRTAGAVAELMASLRQTFTALMGSIVQVDEAVHQLALTARKGAGHSEQASESAASMAAAVEQMTVGINHLSDNAGQAAEIATGAKQRSQEGGQTILRATAEMGKIAGEIHQASEAISRLGAETGQISSIVGVIREVADQTNLLALNAAIEAARAGESGRGFAVVADEVRKLAERTTTSSSEIATMIASIQALSSQTTLLMAQTASQAEQGAVLAQDAGSAIADIQRSADQVKQVVDEISLALGEQSSASQQIAIQTEQVARVAEENSLVAAESTRSAENLERLGEAMRAQVRRFRFE